MRSCHDKKSSDFAFGNIFLLDSLYLPFQQLILKDHLISEVIYCPFLKPNKINLVPGVSRDFTFYSLHVLYEKIDPEKVNHGLVQGHE